MACDALTFTVDKSALEGKQGKFHWDNDGYTEMLAGAYNVPNSIGERYVFTEDVRKLFVRSRMIDKMNLNQLYGEINHPPLDDYRNKARTEEDAYALWMNRLARIDMGNISHHIIGVRWAELPKRQNGRPVYGVFLKLKPIYEVMKQSMMDPNQNTALSVRSFIKREYRMGEFLCVTKDLVTYDYIAHGGIKEATKYNTPSLESDTKEIYTGEPKQDIYLGEGKVGIETQDQVIITPDILKRMDELNAREAGVVGNENTVMYDTMMIRDIAGWRAVPDLGSLVSRMW